MVKKVVKKQKQGKAVSHKHVTLHHHHSKPYRKRHIGLLVVSVVGVVIALVLLVSYRDQVIRGLATSRDFVVGLFNQGASYDLRVQSSHGFSLSYDQKELYASAVDGATGNLYVGNELNQERPYSTVRIAPYWIADTPVQPAFTLTYHAEAARPSASALEDMALNDAGITKSNLTRKSGETATIGGQQFTKSTWQTVSHTDFPEALAVYFTLYTGVVDGHPVTIVISQGISETISSALSKVLSSLSFSEGTAYVAPVSQDVATKTGDSLNLLNSILFTQAASAATVTAATSSSEQVAALYGPAVSRVYNAYCMDISVNGRAYLTGACQAVSGSAFFVSQDGYLGTNGHVASANPLDIIIEDAVYTLVTKGDNRYLAYLLNLTSLKPSDIPSTATDQQAPGMMIDAMYGIDTSRVVATNNVQNLLVGLSDKQPDITAWLEATKNRQTFTSTDGSVKSATVAAVDYRSMDGVDGFEASDVALIKVSGSDYPVTTLGNIDLVNQGADILILGYPGNATNNGIVESTSNQVTITSGKVSSKKKANGSDNMLIETDTTIGHGNSGGPVLSSDGLVIGIATYTADGSGSGNGVFNYIRDIGDLKTLATEEGITFDTNSDTQAAWDKGIEYFYNSRYSRAVTQFEKVQELYPYHTKAQEFIASAQTHIANGDDVQDFPVLIVAIVGVIFLASAGVAVFLIVRHNKKHAIYTAGVARGTVQPIAPGTPQQTVVVAPPAVQPVAQLNIPPATTPTITPVAPQAAPPTPPVAPPAQPAADSGTPQWFSAPDDPNLPPSNNS